MGDKMATSSVLIFATIGGALFGWLSYYIYAYFISFTGTWIKGKATPKEFRIILAWASIPSIAGLILLIPELFIFGDDLFRSELSSSDLLYTISYKIFAMIDIVLGIWTLIILIKGTALIQGFGIGKAILNIFLPLLLLIVLILIIVFIVFIIQ